MPQPDYLGARHPRLVLYLPHRPKGLARLVDDPTAQALTEANSNHWRKIMTLLAKVACPVADEWRQFRDNALFRQTALCFAPALTDTSGWHWIGGQDNFRRFAALEHQARPLVDSPEIRLDPERRLLLTPYPDYRQLSNARVNQVRSALADCGFYDR